MSDKKPNVIPSKGDGTTENTSHPSGISPAEMQAAQQMLENTRRQMEEMQASKQEQLQAAPIEAVSSPEVLSPLAGTSYAPTMTDKHGDMMIPKWDSPFDLIPLPSKGKLYKGIGDKVKVSYMTGSDENILTSPNLIESGDFLEILMTRNLLEEKLSYKDLHLGDRNAIMIWLRGTAFGNMYPISVYSRTGEIIEDEIDLSELKYIPLGAEPDENGQFDFEMPSTKDKVKFTLLTVGDEDVIESKLAAEQELGIEINNRSTYTLMRQIKSVNGNSDPSYLESYAKNVRLTDIKAFRAYVDEIESGIDLKIEVKAAGGETVSTFLPLNLKFFWPDI